MCGHGVVADMVLTGRPLSAPDALALGVVSRVVAPEALDDTAMEMAQKIVAAPTVTVKLARQVLAHLSLPEVRSSMADELIYQTFISRSDDMAELKAARTEGRDPTYTGS
jgi:enoyl-CoA hydratase/carnithine racemase